LLLGEPTITIEFSNDQLNLIDDHTLQEGLEMILNGSIRLGLPGGTGRDDFNIGNSGVSSIKSGYTGITNLGNTCYFSTIIQCLANCPHLKEYFLSMYKCNFHLSRFYSVKEYNKISLCVER
jgi:hypothetical protein